MKKNYIQPEIVKVTIHCNNLMRVMNGSEGQAIQPPTEAPARLGSRRDRVF